MPIEGRGEGSLGTRWDREAAGLHAEKGRRWDVGRVGVSLRTTLTTTARERMQIRRGVLDRRGPGKR